MPSYHVEGFHRNTGKPNLWIYGKRDRGATEDSRGTKDELMIDK